MVEIGRDPDFKNLNYLEIFGFFGILAAAICFCYGVKIIMRRTCFIIKIKAEEKMIEYVDNLKQDVDTDR